MSIDFLPYVEEDVDEIWQYIARDSTFYANRFYDKMLEYINLLEVFPASGRKLFQKGDREYRRIVFHRYNIIYFLEDKIYISLIYNSNRNFNYLKSRFQ